MRPQVDYRAEAEQLAEQPWSREVIADEDGGYLARVPELPGCFADGDSLQEALVNLDSVLRDWLSISLERGDRIPVPRRIDDASFSGRFSVRVPRSLHEALSRRAEQEDCSLNQLVTVLLAGAVHSGTTAISSRNASTDVSENIAADAVRGGGTAIAALKGIGTILRDRGEVNTACVIYAMAANLVATVERAETAAKEFGMAASLARREKRRKLEEALLRESVQRDPTNLRSSSALGQLLYWQGRYSEAVAYLSRAASIDSYARLFLGWSRLLEGINLSDEVEKREGLSDLVEGLHEWCYQNAEHSARTAWLRQVQRLVKLGPKYVEEAKHLIEFANANANWGVLEPHVLTGLETEEGAAPDADEPQDTHSNTDSISGS
jgi:antitoxin HicB